MPSDCVPRSATTRFCKEDMMSDDRPAILAVSRDPVPVVVRQVHPAAWGAHRKGISEVIVRSTAAEALGALLRGLWYMFPEASAADDLRWSAEEFGSRVIADSRMFGITAEILERGEKPAP